MTRIEPFNPEPATPLPAPGGPAASHETVGATAVRGSVWTLGGYAAGQVLRLGGNLILARLLFPAVFGQMALVSIFLQGLQMFSDVGIGPAIVQSPRGDDEGFLNTAWTIQVGRGLALWLGSCAIAIPVADFYGQPALRWLLPVAGINALLAGFEATAIQTLQRRLRLERLTILDLMGQAAGIAGTVLLALVDRSVFGPNHASAAWAVVGGGLIAGVVRLVVSHTALPGIRNRFHLDRHHSRALFGFGRWIFVSTLLTFFAGQADRLVFGKMIPIALFGVYSIAVMLSLLPTQAVQKLGGAVVFPAYSRLAHRADFGEIFWRVRLPILVGGAAVVSGLAACGPLLIRVLYDARYQEAGWILQFLAAMAWFQILECTIGAALLAQGHARWVAAGSAMKVVAMLVLVPLGFHLGDFRGALLGLVLAEAAKYLTAAAAGLLCGLRGFGRDLLVTTACAATSYLGMWSGSAARGWLGGGNLAALGAAAAVTGGIWALLGVRTWRQARAQISLRSGVAPS